MIFQVLRRNYLPLQKIAAVSHGLKVGKRLSDFFAKLDILLCLVGLGLSYYFILQLVTRVEPAQFVLITFLLATEYLGFLISLKLLPRFVLWVSSRGGDKKLSFQTLWRAYIVLSGFTSLFTGYLINAVLTNYSQDSALMWIITGWIFFWLLVLFESVVVLACQKRFHFGFLFLFLSVVQLITARIFSFSVGAFTAGLLSFPVSSLIVWLYFLFLERSFQAKQFISNVKVSLNRFFFNRWEVAFLLIFDIIAVSIFWPSDQAGKFVNAVVAGRLPLVILGVILSIGYWYWNVEKSKVGNFKQYLPRWYLVISALISIVSAVGLYFTDYLMEETVYFPLILWSSACFSLVVLGLFSRKNNLYRWLFIAGEGLIVIFFIFSHSINSYVLAIALLSSVMVIGSILIYISDTTHEVIWRNLKDIKLFFNGNDFPPVKNRLGTIRVLMIAREDITAYRWSEKAKRVFYKWRRQRYDIFLLCGNDKFLPRYERRYGVSIIRRGGRFSLFIFAVFYWLFRFYNRFDTIVIVDLSLWPLRPIFVGVPVVVVRPIVRRGKNIFHRCKFNLAKFIGQRYFTITPRAFSRFDIRTLVH